MNDLVKLLVVIAAAILAMLSWNVSRSLGADFGVTLWAIILLLLVTAGVIWFCLAHSIPFLTGASGWAVLAWPCCFNVLDNIAEKQAISFTVSSTADRPWFGANMFQFGLEAALVAIFFLVIFKRDPYR
ncbi:MAG: hypothetical protein K2X55_27440 [Burkholderiaceae bacterium]|nr:hypothetical protein [Burkholderiaceae bacterium]